VARASEESAALSRRALAAGKRREQPGPVSLSITNISDELSRRANVLGQTRIGRSNASWIVAGPRVGAHRACGGVGERHWQSKLSGFCEECRVALHLGPGGTRSVASGAGHTWGGTHGHDGAWPSTTLHELRPAGPARTAGNYFPTRWPRHDRTCIPPSLSRRPILGACACPLTPLLPCPSHFSAVAPPSPVCAPTARWCGCTGTCTCECPNDRR